MIRRKMARISGWAVGATVFLASAWYLFTTCQWYEIANLLWQVRFLWLATAGVSITMYWFVRAVRWHILLRQLGVDIALGDLYLCSAVALGLAIITPFQSGEVLKIELLKKYGKVGRFSGYSSFLVERVVDLAVVFGLAIVTLISNADFGIDRDTIITLLAVALAFGGAATIVVWNVQLPGRPGRFQTSMRDCVRRLPVFVSVLVLTLAGWGLVAVGWYACLVSIGCDVGYVNTVMIMSTLTPLHILSLIPGAIGVAEAVPHCSYCIWASLLHMLRREQLCYGSLAL